MPEFRLTQISDTHLARRHQSLTDNFHRVSEYIDATRPDLVVNSGDVAWDAPTSPDDFEFARELHDALAAPCRYLPGNHDIGDNPTEHGPVPSQPVTEQSVQAFRACFGCRSLALRSRRLVLHRPQFACHEHGPGERGRTGRLAGFTARKRQRQAGGAVPAQAAVSECARRSGTGGDRNTAIVPMPARGRLVQMLDAVDLRLVASGHVHQRRDFTFRHARHVWAPSAGFIIPDSKQEVIGTKEVGLVEYRFQPDAFEVRHVRAPGQIDVDLDALLRRS